MMCSFMLSDTKFKHFKVLEIYRSCSKIELRGFATMKDLCRAVLCEMFDLPDWVESEAVYKLGLIASKRVRALRGSKRKLDEYIGQEIVFKRKVLNLIQAQVISNVIVVFCSDTGQNSDSKIQSQSTFACRNQICGKDAHSESRNQ